MLSFSTILFIFGSVSFYGIALVIYRLFFHPLARFPGPKIVAATKWWEFYKDVLVGSGGTFAFDIDKMHDDYGPIVRVAPDEIHVKDPEWFETLYNTPGQVRDKYAPSAYMVGTPLGTFGTISHEVHRKRRGGVSRFFSKRSITLSEPTFHSKAKLLCDSIRNHLKKNEPYNVSVDYLAYASESVYQTGFGKQLGLFADYEAAKDWRKTMDAVGAITPLAKQISWLIPIAINLPSGLVRIVAPDLARLFSIHKRMHRLASESIAENNDKKYTLDNESVPTVFQSILSSQLPDEEKRRDRLAQDGFIIIVAGSDTISKILTSATFHILDNKSALLRLQQELREAIPDPKVDVDSRYLEKLPWLTGVIKESLRIAALLTSRLPLISPHESLHYHDWEVPAGTPVSMTLGSILTDPTVYPEPYKFRPERWLEGSPEAETAHRFLVPFNRGTRSCIGMNFAYAELYVVLATVFRRFELELFDTIRERDVDYKFDCFLGRPSVEGKGVRVKVVRELD